MAVVTIFSDFGKLDKIIDVFILYLYNIHDYDLFLKLSFKR